MRRALSVVLVSSTLLFCGGCAVFNRDNTPALNFVEQHLVPRDQTARALSYPLTVPIGLTAATLDMVLLHPLSVAGDAWDDTNDLLWKGLDWDGRYVTTTVLQAPPRAAAVPAFFAIDFLARSSFDISRRGGDVRLNKGGPDRRENAAPAEGKSRPELSM